MGRVKFTTKDMHRLGRVENEKGVLVPVSSLTARPGTVKKLPNLLERALEQKSSANEVVSENKKVKGATKIERFGIRFDSILECFMYTLLKDYGIDFEFQYTYLVQPKIKYGSMVIRAIKVKVDFWISSQNKLIDTKGFSTRVSQIKYKLLRKHLLDQQQAGLIDELPNIEMPATKEECQLLANRLKYENN